MNVQQTKAMLLKMIAAVAALNGVIVCNDNSKKDLVGVVEAQLKAQLAVCGDQKAIDKIAKLYTDAYTDKEKMAELCGIRLQQSTNYIYASSNFMASFFEIVSLENNERPYWKNNTKMELGVRYIGQHGEPKLQRAIAPQEEFALPLRWLVTDEFEYILQDIYSGDIRGAAEATVDIAFDVTNKMDADCFALLDAMFGNFTTTGARQNQTYVRNSRVLAGNLPTTNKLDVTGEDGEQILCMIRAIIQYCSQWGKNAFAGGPLVPTGKIFLGSKNATDLLWSETMKPEGVTNNTVAEGIMGDYAQFDFAGRTWSLIPDNTLAPGFGYPELSKKPGQVFLKPKMDEEIETLNRKKNLVSRYQKRVFAGYIPEHHKPFACRVQFTPRA